MKKRWWISLLVSGASLFSYQGQNSNPGYIFPIDGGRKVTPMVDNQSGMEFEIGYVAVTSIDSEGGLNATQDQQNVNQLLSQINQLYVKIYNKYNSNATRAPSNYTPPPTQAPPPPQSSCSHRRSSKWRQP